MAHGWSEAEAGQRLNPSNPGEDLHRHNERASLTRRVCCIVLRMPTSRKLLARWVLFVGIAEGTKRQAGASGRAPPGLTVRCLGTVVYKVTQGPLARGQTILSSFPPLARECFFLLELESRPRSRYTIVALVLTSIYRLDAAVGVLTL